MCGTARVRTPCRTIQLLRAPRVSICATTHTAVCIAVSALPLALVLSLAAQWGQPVAPKTLAAEAVVESGLDPLAIHDNTTDRTYRPTTPAEAVEIASRLDRAGSDFDAGLMQINHRNFAWLHLTIAGAFDPRRSIEAGAAVLVSMSRYNTGNLRGFTNGYVQKVLDATHKIDEQPSDIAAPAPIPPAPPPVVVDMLHGTEAPPAASGQVVNLLAGIVPSASVQTAER